VRKVGEVVLSRTFLFPFSLSLIPDLVARAVFRLLEKVWSAHDAGIVPQKRIFKLQKVTVTLTRLRCVWDGFPPPPPWNCGTVRHADIR